MDQNFLNSSYREKIIEHLFVGELLKISWLSGECSVEIARPEVDNGGYDLIAESCGIVRHIQLKTSHIHAKASFQKTHTSLANKPSGCIIWIYFDQESMELGPFRFFGAKAGEPLQDLTRFKTAKHTKSNTEGVKTLRPKIKQIPKASFEKLETIKQIYDRLFVPV